MGNHVHTTLNSTCPYCVHIYYVTLQPANLNTLCSTLQEVAAEDVLVYWMSCRRYIQDSFYSVPLLEDTGTKPKGFTLLKIDCTATWMLQKRCSLVQLGALPDQTIDVDISRIKKEIRTENRHRSDQPTTTQYEATKRTRHTPLRPGVSLRDAICLRYGWTLHCGKAFEIDHEMTCPMGGYPTLRHNEIRDMTAQLLTWPTFNHSQASTNINDGARLDIRARSFWL